MAEYIYTTIDGSSMESELMGVIPSYVRESNPNLVGMIADAILRNNIVMDRGQFTGTPNQPQSPVSFIFPEVKKGDLITAELMNRIIAAVVDLDQRVKALGTGTDNRVIITSISPSGSLRIGTQVQVLGSNFGLSTGTGRVDVDGFPVNSFLTGSNDQRLIFVLPTIPNIPLDGRTVTLRVVNGASFDSRNITLLPAQPLSGSISINWFTAVPTTFQANSEGTLGFSIASGTNLDATYTVNPVVTLSNSQQWTGQVDVLDAAGNVLPDNMIQVNTGSQKQFFIRFNSVPDVEGFSLTVRAAAGAVSASSGPVDIVLGSPIELPNQNISLSYETAEFAPLTSGTFQTGDEVDTIRLSAGGTAQITLLARFRAAGAYTVSAEPWTNDTQNWNLRVHPQSSTTYTVTAGQLDNPQKKHDELPRFLISPNSGGVAGEASTTGAVVFKIEHPESKTSRKLRMNLALNAG